jgi:hypothetical protein
MPELKVTQQHLERDAYLYVRQSTVRQVLENNESTRRQYALRDRAVVLGWPLERIHVLDCDLGKRALNRLAATGFRNWSVKWRSARPGW